MILGVVRDHLARVTLTLPGAMGAVAVEFILDTGFDADLTLPSSVLRQLDARPLFTSCSFLRNDTSGGLVNGRECSPGLEEGIDDERQDAV